MQKENVTGSNEAPKTEVKAEEAKGETKGLSLRDALEVAHEATKQEPVNESVTKDTSKKPIEEGTKEPEKTAEAADKTSDPKVQRLQAPGEWTAEEKADFEALSEKQQNATLRLYNTRKKTLQNIQQEAADLQWAKDLAKEVEPYLKAVGGKKKAHEALIDALKMRREFDEGDPKEAAREYLKAKGIPIPKELLDDDSGSRIDDEKIIPLQKDLDAVKLRLAQEDQAKVASVLSSAWQDFERAKNAAGTPKYPDINNTESGIRISSYIGSLVRGDTALSKQFIASVRDRIPGADFNVLLQEAYKFSGGRVDDSDAPKTQSTQKHIAKSSRAASSVPGRGAHSTSSGPVKVYKTRREATEAALVELREREGQ